MKKLLFLFLLIPFLSHGQLQLPFGIKVLNPQPLDYYYYNNSGIPYVSTTQANTQISSSIRYIGQTVLIGTVEYCYKTGITDGDLVIKNAGGGGSSTFTSLTDGPGNYTGRSLNLVRVNVGETALEYQTLAQVKSNMGLNLVDNTSDVNKPVSTLQGIADALNLKIASNLSDVNNRNTALNNLLPSQASANTKVLTSNGTDASWQTPSGGGGSSTFTGLTDGPGAFTGKSLNFTRVNVGETSLEYQTPSQVKSALTINLVDNTPDASKPVSTAQAAADALNLKIASNLSDLANTATARTNLGLLALATKAAANLTTDVTGILPIANGGTGNTSGTATIIPTLSGDVSNSGNAVTVIKINGVSPAALGTGLVKNTTGTGAFSIATAGTDYTTPSSTETVTNKNLTSGTNTFPTFNQSTTGSAATLTTSRNINTVAFNGSANISIPGMGAANRQTSSYTLVLSDANNFVEQNVASSNTLTVPPNSSVAFPVGTQVTITQYGAGLTTLAAGAGVTLRTSSGTLTGPGQYLPMVLYKIGTDEWYLWNGQPNSAVSGSYSSVGSATTTFTVTIGSTQANTSYKIVATPTVSLAAAPFYVSNKTTTTFDVVYLSGLTGTVTFDWSLNP